MSFLNPGAIDGQIDMVTPVNWFHPLNRGLRAWLLFVPGSGLSSVIPDVAKVQGGGCPGTLTNGALPVSPLGRQGGWGAWDLDGTDDYIEIANPTFLRSTSGPFSICVWLRPDFAPSSTNRSIFQWGVDGADAPRFFIRYNSPEGFFADGSSQSLGQTSAAFLWTLGDWFHFTYTNSGAASSGQYYKNGLAVSTVGNGGIPQSPETFTIARLGRFRTADPRQFDGRMDDFRFYDRALQPQEVKALYESSRMYYYSLLNRLEPAWITAEPPAVGGDAVPQVWSQYRRRRAG
jgi:hypothetical protein